MRTKRLVGFAIAVAIAAGLTIVPSAFASDIVKVPSKVVAGKTTIKIEYFNDDTGKVVTRTYKASPTNSTFRTYRSGSIGAKSHKVSFKTFKSYVKKHGASTLMNVKWTWRTSGGKRYRYIKSISVSNYHG